MNKFLQKFKPIRLIRSIRSIRPIFLIFALVLTALIFSKALASLGFFSTDSLNKGLVGHWPLDGAHYNSTTNRVTLKSQITNNKSQTIPNGQNTKYQTI